MLYWPSRLPCSLNSSGMWWWIIPILCSLVLAFVRKLVPQLPRRLPATHPFCKAVLHTIQRPQLHTENNGKPTACRYVSKGNYDQPSVKVRSLFNDGCRVSTPDACYLSTSRFNVSVAVRSITAHVRHPSDSVFYNASQHSGASVKYRGGL